MRREQVPGPGQAHGGRALPGGEHGHRLVAHLAVAHRAGVVAVVVHVAESEQHPEQVVAFLRRGPARLDQAVDHAVDVGDVPAKPACHRQGQPVHETAQRPYVKVGPPNVRCRPLAHLAQPPRIFLQIEAEERPGDDPPDEILHLQGHVDPGPRRQPPPALVPAQGVFDHGPAVALDSPAMELRLNEAPVAQVVGLFGGRQPAAHDHAQRFEVRGTPQLAVMGHEKLLHQVGVAHQVQQHGLPGQGRDVPVRGRLVRQTDRIPEQPEQLPHQRTLRGARGQPGLDYRADIRGRDIGFRHVRGDLSGRSVVEHITCPPPPFTAVHAPPRPKRPSAAAGAGTGPTGAAQVGRRPPVPASRLLRPEHREPLADILAHYPADAQVGAAQEGDKGR